MNLILQIGDGYILGMASQIAQTSQQKGIIRLTSYTNTQLELAHEHSMEIDTCKSIKGGIRLVFTFSDKSKLSFNIEPTKSE